MRLKQKDKTKYSVTIYGQPATKKNSSVLARGRAMLLPSKAYREYCKVFRQQLPANLPHYCGPVQLTAVYYLQNRAHYPDLNGLIQATQDIISDEYATFNHKRILVKQWLVADDRLVKSLDGSRIGGIDKKKPRVEITIAPLVIDTDTETDPYILKAIKEQENEFCKEAET